MKYTTKFWVAIVSMISTVSSMAGAEALLSAAEAVDVAGKQRMFTMRLLRDYVMIGENLRHKDPASDLRTTIEQYERSQAALNAYIQDPALRKEHQAITQEWGSIKQMLQTAPDQSKAAHYAGTMIHFREALNTFVNHLSQSLGGGGAEAVNLSGRLRAVSQALASVYQLRVWGLKGTDKKWRSP